MNQTISALTLVALASLAACGSKEPPKPEATASAVPSSKLAPRPSATVAIAASSAVAPKPAPVGPKWLAAVPPRSVLSKPGDRVWALEPVGATEAAIFNVFEVASVEGQTVTTAALARGAAGLAKDEKAPVHAGEPAALLTTAAPLSASKIKVDDLVVTPVPGFHTTVGHVTKVAGKVATFKYANGEKVDEETTEYAAPLAKGIEPFAYVAVKSGAGYKEGLVTSVVDDQVFAIDDAGNVLAAPKADVKPLDIQWKERKSGDKVTVFDASGSSEATIDKMSVTKWIFLVKIGSTSKRVPFYAVVDKI